jgi:hypothetical protein
MKKRAKPVMIEPEASLAQLSSPKPSAASDRPQTDPKMIRNPRLDEEILCGIGISFCRFSAE